MCHYQGDIRGHHGPPAGPGKPVIRLPPQKVQEQQRLAETLGGLHKLLSLFLQNFSSKTINPL